MVACYRVGQDMDGVQIAPIGRGVRIAFTTGATSACIVAVASKLAISQLWATLTDIDPYYLIGSLLALVGFYFLRAIRWRVILRGTLPAREAFALSSIGYLASSALPLQGGELVKVHLLNRRVGAGYAVGLASVALERALDLLAIVLLAGLSVVYSAAVGASALSALSEQRALVGGSWVFTPVIAVSLLLTGVLAVSIWRVLKRWCRGRGVSLGGIIRQAPAISPVLDAAAGLRSRSAITKIVALTIGAWCLNFVSVWLAVIPLAPSATAWEVMLGFSLVTLGLLVPLAPGYVGQYELLWIGVFSVMGAQQELTLVYVPLVVHGVILLTIAGLGVGGALALLTPGRRVGQAVWRTRLPRHMC